MEIQVQPIKNTREIQLIRRNNFNMVFPFVHPLNSLGGEGRGEGRGDLNSIVGQMFRKLADKKSVA